MRRFWKRQFHQDRAGRAKLAISTSVLFRLATTLMAVLILPITVRYLGKEGYGLMIVIVSIVGWLDFANLGIGLGLQNALTEATTLADKRMQNQLVSTAFFALLGVGLILTVTSIVAFPWVDWLRVFPAHDSRHVTSVPMAVVVVLGAFILNTALGFLTPIYAARQELHMMHVQGLVATILSLSGTVLMVYRDGGLLGIVICTAGIPATVNLSFAIWTLLLRGLPELRPRWSAVQRDAWRRVYRNGIGFLILQMCCIATFQADAFVIAHLLSIEQVTPYSVAQKVFFQLSGIFTLVTTSMWPAYGNAKAKGDAAWIRRSHARVMKVFFVLYGSLVVGMIAVGQPLLRLWVGEASAPGTWLIAAVALHFFIRSWTSIYALLLNGLDVIRPQVVVMSVHAALTIALYVVLVQHLGVYGIPVGGVVSYTLVLAWYLPWLAHRSLKAMRPARGMPTLEPAD